MGKHANIMDRLERIKKVKYHLARGIAIREIAKLLKVSENTIHSDIKLIRKDLIADLKKEPIEQLLFNLRLNLDQIKKEYWDMAKDRKHPNIKLGALNSLLKANEVEINLMQKLGVFEYIEQHNVEIKSDLKEFKNFLFNRKEKADRQSDQKAKKKKKTKKKVVKKPVKNEQSKEKLNKPVKK